MDDAYTQLTHIGATSGFFNGGMITTSMVATSAMPIKAEGMER